MPPQSSSCAQARPRRWFVSFDCATKTFAFAIASLQPARLRSDIAALRARLRAIETEVGALPQSPDALSRARALREQATQLAADTQATLQQQFWVHDSETRDLVPGARDASVCTADRLSAVVRFLQQRVEPAVARIVDGPLTALIEFQLGANAPARVVAACVATFFIQRGAEVCFVGPAIKNTISVAPGGEYSAWVSRYRTLSSANKQHTLWNLKKARAVFGWPEPACLPKLWGHVADAVFQAIAFAIRIETNAEMAKKY